MRDTPTTMENKLLFAELRRSLSQIESGLEVLCWASLSPALNSLDQSSCLEVTILHSPGAISSSIDLLSRITFPVPTEGNQYRFISSCSKQWTKTTETTFQYWKNSKIMA